MSFCYRLGIRKGMEVRAEKGKFFNGIERCEFICVCLPACVWACVGLEP